MSYNDSKADTYNGDEKFADAEKGSHEAHLAVADSKLRGLLSFRGPLVSSSHYPLSQSSMLAIWMVFNAG